MGEICPESIEMREAEVTVKKPKRVLHFSDGTIEEYSDEDEVDSCENETTIVDTESMDWGTWLAYKAVQTGSTTLGFCDSVGESLASFFGITSPKYYFEAEESKRIEQEKKDLEIQKAGWVPQEETIATQQPLNSDLSNGILEKQK